MGQGRSHVMMIINHTLLIVGVLLLTSQHGCPVRGLYYFFQHLLNPIIL